MRVAGHCLTIVAALALSVTYATAQTNMPTGGSGNSSGSSGNANTYRPPDLLAPSFDPSISHRQLVARREEAHRRMLDNANRLLALTSELEDAIRLHGASAADAKSLDDIAKLARAVRDGMRQ